MTRSGDLAISIQLKNPLQLTHLLSLDLFREMRSPRTL